MARWTELDRTAIDALVDEWRESCLIEGRSLLAPEQAVWTSDNFDVLWDRFVLPELLDSRAFEEKLTEQLDGVPEGPVRLMAELIAIYVLFASPGRVGEARKRELISFPLGFIDETLPAEGLLADALWVVLGGPGQAFNIRRPYLIKYLVRFGRALAAHTQERRRVLVAADADPWAFRDWLVAVEDVDGARTMRNILLHLLFPDTFERIAIDEDKAQIVYAFAGLVGGLDPAEADVDRALFDIRHSVENLLPDGQPIIDGGVDFYYPPLREGWDTEDSRVSRPERDGLPALDALRYKQQIVFYGPPGTGKTHEAKALAAHFIRQEAMRLWGPAHSLQNQARVPPDPRPREVRDADHEGPHGPPQSTHRPAPRPRPGPSRSSSRTSPSAPPQTGDADRTLEKMGYGTSPTMS